MRKHLLVIITIFFFVIMNSSYFWMGTLGASALPITFILFVLFILLAIVLVFQIYWLIKERFNNRYRVLVVSVMSVVLSSIFFWPTGIIPFEKLEPHDLLIAEREGAANCYTTLKLKVDNKFIEKSICFGESEVRGEYLMKGDSIFFSNVQLGRDVDNYYQFAVIKNSGFQNKKILGELKRFKNYSDTLPHDLFITKNELKY